MKTNKAILSLLCLFLLFDSGCAYFNAFYLAKRNFRDGEFERGKNEGISNQTSNKNYREAVKWAREVIAEYPDSKYVDDSMYIISLSQYYQKNYTMARSQLDELLRTFPESEYREEAKYYKALSYIGLEQYENAILVLDDLIKTDDSDMKSQAGLAYAEIAELNERWDGLLEAAETVLGMKPGRNEFIKACIYKGEALYNLERYEECVEVLEPLEDFGKMDIDSKVNYTIRLAQSQAQLESYDKALSLLSVLESKGEFMPYHDELSLEKGFIYELQGDDELAAETYTLMAADYPDSVAADDAWYRVGVITLKDLSLANDARQSFEKVGQQPPNVTAPYYVDAKQKIANIDSLNAHLSRIKEYEGDIEKITKTRFSLGGLYMFMFDRPDSAAGQYQTILRDAPGTEFAIMSDFYIRRFSAMEDGQIDEATERAVAEEIITEYPSSDFAVTLRNYIGVTDNTPHVIALQKAEDARNSGASWEEYLPLYQEVADNYPESRSAYQARLNLAYYYEHDAGDSEKSVEIYRELADETPSFISEMYVETARDKIRYLEEEPALLEEIRTYIADFDMRREESPNETQAADNIAVAVIDSPEKGLTGFQRIRARNARIRSRYYSD